MMRKCDWCAYETKFSSNLCTHRKSCKKRPADGEKDQLRERVAVLEQQLAAALERNATLELVLLTNSWCS